MSKQVLTLNDISRHIASSELCCPLFWYQGRLLRSYNLSMFTIFNKILSSNIPAIQTATPTEFMLDFTGIDGSDDIMPVYEHTIYKHHIRIQELPITYAKEFIANICKLNSELVKHGLIARDIQESNAVQTIDGFKWLDYGGIFENTPENSIIAFVLTSYLVRRWVLKSTQCNAYELCLDDIKNTNDILTSFIEKDYTTPEAWLELAQAISDIPVTLDKSHWSENYSNTMDIDHPESLQVKGINIANILQELDYETVTDVACNKGYYSFLSAKKAKSVIGFDLVSACIDMAYGFNRQFKLPAIFAVKTIESIRDNKWFETDRYKSDLVLALAIVHHIKDVISPSDFVKTLLSISNEYILIEDIDDMPTYERLFIDHGCELVKRVDSYPLPRTLSLYRKL